MHPQFPDCFCDDSGPCERAERAPLSSKGLAVNRARERGVPATLLFGRPDIERFAHAHATRRASIRASRCASCIGDASLPGISWPGVEPTMLVGASTVAGVDRWLRTRQHAPRQRLFRSGSTSDTRRRIHRCGLRLGWFGKRASASPASQRAPTTAERTSSVCDTHTHPGSNLPAGARVGRRAHASSRRRRRTPTIAPPTAPAPRARARGRSGAA